MGKDKGVTREGVGALQVTEDGGVVMKKKKTSFDENEKDGVVSLIEYFGFLH